MKARKLIYPYYFDAIQYKEDNKDKIEIFINQETILTQMCDYRIGNEHWCLKIKNKETEGWWYVLKGQWILKDKEGKVLGTCDDKIFLKYFTTKYFTTIKQVQDS